MIIVEKVVLPALVDDTDKIVFCCSRRARFDRLYARPTTTIALCGIKFFFEKTLGTRWTIFDLIRPSREKKRRPQPRRQEVWS